MRWYTCTPVAFGGGADFFARDSGLLCRGLQMIGVESRAVMPGERQAQDDGDLIRTEYKNLESAAWWRSHKLDGVVLYAWGSPKFRKVAAAIQQAGIFLVLNQDNGGLISPLAGLADWLREQWILTGQGRGWRTHLHFCSRVLRGASAGLFLTDPRRAAHLRHGNVIACVSPKAAGYYRKLCRSYGGAELAGRVVVVPHAVEPRFCFAGDVKRRQVACVGRWADVVQKRPWLLMDTLGRLVAADARVELVIAGQVTSGLEGWHRSLTDEQGGRVHLRGMVARDELVEILRSSRVFYSPSAFESFGIAAAEALCCGCSVVAGRSVSMTSFEWFVADASGTLADEDDAQGHFVALQRELSCWAQGARSAQQIAGVWGARLHADRVAGRLLALAAGETGDY